MVSMAALGRPVEIQDLRIPRPEGKDGAGFSVPDTEESRKESRSAPRSSANSLKTGAVPAKISGAWLSCLAAIYFDGGRPVD
jgi:hypothetical protein